MRLERQRRAARAAHRRPCARRGQRRFPSCRRSPSCLRCFRFLEDSGYLARAAFITDRALGRLGLSGSSFAPLLLGFGCTVPAVMAARTVPDARSRRLTVLLLPFVSCSAKLPVLTLFAAAFSRRPALALLLLYAASIAVGLLAAQVLKKDAFPHRRFAVPYGTAALPAADPADDDAVHPPPDRRFYTQGVFRSSCSPRSPCGFCRALISGFGWLRRRRTACWRTSAARFRCCSHRSAGATGG